MEIATLSLITLSVSFHPLDGHALPGEIDATNCSDLSPSLTSVRLRVPNKRNSSHNNSFCVLFYCGNSYSLPVCVPSRKIVLLEENSFHQFINFPKEVS